MRDRVRTDEESPAPTVERRPEPGAGAHALHQLQRRVGNAAVVQMVGAQAKLTVGAVNDPAEREADRVAAEVLRRLEGGGGDDAAIALADGGVARQIRRRAVGGPVGAEGGEVTDDVTARLERSRAGGQPMADDVRRSMEGAFGADFSGVRIHTGGEADTLSSALGARAFATGNDVFFAKGEYDPSSRSGRATLAHELTHTVQQAGGAHRKIRRFVDIKTFKERTSEGFFTGKSTAQKEIEKYLAAYAALGAKNDKGKIVIPDAKLKQAMDLILSMKTAAEAWIGAHTLDDKAGGTMVDPKKANRAAGMAWFFMAADGELANLENRLNTEAEGTSQDEVVADTAGRLKLKEHYQGNLSGSLTKLGNLLDKIVPSDGDSTELSIDLKIPVHPGVFVGGTLSVEAGKDDGKVEAGLEAAFQAGGTAGLADVAGALGGYFKAGAKTGVEVMRLVSYGFYRKCVESSVIPAEISSAIWGGGSSEYAKKKADKWSLGVETDLLGEGSENFVELGGLASVSAEAGVGIASMEAEAKYSSGKRYDAESLKNRKGGAGQANKGSDSFFTKNVANKFGRGAEKSTGRSTNNLDLSFGASLLGGMFSGELASSMSWRDKGLTAAERAKPGAVTTELEDVEFSLVVGGSMPGGTIGAQLISLLADAAKYAKKQTDTAANTAKSKGGAPVSELMLAKSYAQLVYDSAQGVPIDQWFASAAEEGGDSLLESSGSIGLELEMTVEKTDKGWDGSVELKYVNSKSVELPEILEVELVRKTRLGKAVYSGGAWK